MEQILNTLLFHQVALKSKTAGKNIKDNVFSCCKRLIEVKFNEDSKLKLIGNEAFAESSLKIIKIPASVEKIGSVAFKKCQNLVTVEFSDDSLLDKFEFDLFSESSIEYITIPPNVTEIEYMAFDKCLKLKEVSFHENCKLSVLKKKNRSTNQELNHSRFL